MTATINGNQLTALRQTPLTCSGLFHIIQRIIYGLTFQGLYLGHTRPVVFLAFSAYNQDDSANYFMISACKGNENLTLALR